MKTFKDNILKKIEKLKDNITKIIKYGWNHYNNGILDDNLILKDNITKIIWVLEDHITKVQISLPIHSITNNEWWNCSLKFLAISNSFNLKCKLYCE